MIGWLLLGRAAGRRDERRRLEAQAERQRRRAPEPGPDVILPEAPRYPSRHDEEAAAAWWFAKWVGLPILVALGFTVSWWVFWIGLAAMVVAVSTYLGFVR
jgi:hypothetical protein